MKKTILILTLILLAGMLTSCSGKMIEPGDKVGNFTVTTGEQGQFTYGFSVDCGEPGSGNAYTCSATVGEIINVSTGVFVTTENGNLDDTWAHSNYQMFIDNRPVDLAAFGTIDFNHQQVGTIRFANVVITTEKPGQITVKDSGVYDNGDPFSSTSTYNFNAP